MFRTLSWKEFIKRVQLTDQSDYFIDPKERYYLRALGNDPRKDPADFTIQYPELSPDINLPMFFGKDKIFSSVLRISSPDCQLWTHYDVMDNFLVQVVGRKKVVLFDPTDALCLYLVGDKSPILDVESPDLTTYPLFKNADQYHCELSPGDVLFIPSLWFHNVLACDFSVAVNVFWKHLDVKFYDTKDAYGNKDPPQAQKASQLVDKAMKCIEELPNDLYKDFYARCIVNKIQQKFFLK
jgi:tRNA wybutosine-synthesizing protein 5